MLASVVVGKLGVASDAGVVEILGVDLGCHCSSERFAVLLRTPRKKD